MKIVYIAGPYSKSKLISVNRNIKVARDAAMLCARHNIGFLCPHLNSAHFDTLLPEVSKEFYYEMYLTMLQCCDAILLLPKWESSEGTVREVALCDSLGIPRFELPPQHPMVLPLGLLQWIKRP